MIITSKATMNSPSPLFLLLLLCLSGAVLATLAPSASALGGMVGGWTPVKNPDDPHLKELAEFAVREYNKQLKATLALSRVINAETQVVSGTNYRLVIDVHGSGGSGGSKRYEAVVWEKPWEHFMKLTSFKPL